MASERMIVIADASKRVDMLGKFPCPSRRCASGSRRRARWSARWRPMPAAPARSSCGSAKDGKPFVTDSGNVLFDCAFARIDNPEALDQALKRVPGVVENGLFLGIADAAIIAGPEGVVVIERDAAPQER